MGVRVEMPSNQPIVLLKELDGVRYLPIWLGAVEATAIAFAQQEVAPPRPLTHDLFKDVLLQLGAKLNDVYLTELKDGVFYAQLNFAEGPAVSARPSDAIALALRPDKSRRFPWLSPTLNLGLKYFVSLKGSASSLFYT